MINDLKSKLQELDSKKTNIKPKIDELNAKKDEEIQAIKDNYDKMISEANAEVIDFEKTVYNDLIESFMKSVMNEFDAKRSMSEYKVTNQIKDYLDFIKTVDLVPKDLTERLEKIVGGDPIENLAYDIDKIKEKYIK